MQIVEYQDVYKQDFVDLNVAWIEKYFTMEQPNYDALCYVEEYVAKGGIIFFAVENDVVLATRMRLLMAQKNGRWQSLPQMKRFRARVQVAQFLKSVWSML